MAKEKDTKSKITLLGYDPVETPEEIIDSDHDGDRKDAFKQAYKKVMQIIPDYFMSARNKRKKAGASGGNSFTQNIIVTTDNIKIETNEVDKKEQEKEEKERGE